MQSKNILFTSLIFTIVILLTACEPAVPVNSPMDTATVSTSATPTNLSLPTETITTTPQSDPVTQNCVNVLPNAPANFTTKGIIPLEDYQTWNTVFLNLETGDTANIPSVKEYIWNFAVSPDRKTLAYKTHETPSRFSLTLTDALNQHSQVILVRKTDFALGNWLNNQQLLLGKDGKFVVFSPYTQEEKSYSIDDFPDYDTNSPHNNGGWVGIDPQATIAVYKANSSNTVLLDLDSKQIIAQVIDAYERFPVAKWTLDGSEAAIVGTTVVGKYPSDAGDNIFDISRDGQVTQLTHLAEHYGIGFNIHSLSWSPDSRFIAFWMWYPGVSSNDWVLAVLDTSTKRVTDYCISTDPYAINNRRSLPGLSAPIWSPDGQQIIVEHRTNDSKYVVLLDIKQNIAFQITQNAYPAGWMIAEP